METSATSDAGSDAPNGLELRALACRRGERLVFAGLDATLAPGEALLLIGANGSGKSSLLRLLAGLGRPFAGEIRWRGRPVAEDSDTYCGETAYLGHANAIKPALSVRENLRFWARMAGHEGAALENETQRGLAAFSLEDLAEDPARLLSSGQSRRLALARLPVSGARLWLLDEPTVGLDIRAQQAFEAVVNRHLAAGGLVVAATHTPLDLPNARSLEVSNFAPHPADRPGGEADSEWESLWEDLR